jgi:SPP1 gp7 family putative phage head morphogenesis protein
VIDFARIVKARTAAEQALGVIVTTNVTKALDPLDRDDFLRIASQVATALQNDARPYEVSAVARAIDAISGVEWASLTREEMNAAIDAIRSITNDVGKVVMPSVSETFRITGGRTMAATRESAIRRFGFTIDTSLAQRDLAAERWIRSLNTLFVRDAYGVRADDLAAIAREVVTNGVEQGLGSSTIAQRLAETVGSRIAQPASYWQVVATAFSNTGRTFSQIGSFRDAGITSYQFEAVLDEVTTDQCRFYHGQTFSVGDATARIEALTQLTDPEAVKNENPWIRTGRDEEGNRVLYFTRDGERTTIATIDRSGVGARDDRGSYSGAASASQLSGFGIPWPPLHGNCRSTIIPVVG